MTVYSAPGKLFVFGEYAVLRGAPAIVAAVDRRVRVTSTGDDAYRVVGTDTPSTRLPQAVESVTGRPVRGWEADLTQMYEGTDKLGLGSSAASCVALTAAVLGRVDPEHVFPAAFDAHLAFQRGAGSGADVAASTYGGFVSVRRTDGRPDVCPTVLNPAISIYAVWTGESADTREFVAAVNAANTAGELAALAELAEAAPVVLAGEDPAAALDLVRRYDAAMGALGAVAGVPIRTAVHEALVRGVAELGAVAKPSGAGGGDVSLVFSATPLDEAHLRTALPPGAQLLALRLGVQGVNCFSESGRSC